MDKIQLPQGYRATARKQFTFIPQVSCVPLTHFIDLCSKLTTETLEQGVKYVQS